MSKKSQILCMGVIVLLFGMIASIPEAHAQTQIGSVSKEGEWYVGEGLKIGDYFTYDLCHVNYKECKKFQISFWIKGESQIGNESKWIAPTVVYDGTKTLKGIMELAKVAPEPIGGTPELLKYRSAFKSSVVWLSAFATSYEGSSGTGAKQFNMPSWGKIANIGGEQILPKEVRTIYVRGGTFEDAISLEWRTGGSTSKVWIVDEFPFPIRASTFVHVSEGIPPQEYKFELIKYGNQNTNPYTDIIATNIEKTQTGCPINPGLVKKKQGTTNSLYLVNFQYGPKMPVAGCDMVLLISFHSKYDETEFLNQVQYDIVVTDSNDIIIHEVSVSEGLPVLYSASGQTRNDEMWVPSEPGEYTYTIIIYGLAPNNIEPRTGFDTFRVPITVVANSHITIPTLPTTPTSPITPSIPSWIKTAVGAWADDITSDVEFTSAIEYLISQNVIIIGPVDIPASGTSGIPSWIKVTAGAWANDITSDVEFTSAIEFLITKGVIIVN